MKITNNKFVRNDTEVLEVHGALLEANESINKLELVHLSL